MLRFQATLTVACFMFLAYFTNEAGAGRNAGGKARLTWDESGLELSIPAAPSDSFPLFLGLVGAPEVRALSVMVQWFPTDPTGKCYGLLPASNGAGCSTTSSDPPNGDFQGEPTTTWWSISPPPVGSDGHCVTWLVTSAGCLDPHPAVFTALVRVEDYHGNIDTLQVLEPATIGSAVATILQASSVAPTAIVPGTPTMLRIRGAGFSPGSRVTLSNESGGAEASRVVVLAPDEIVATIAAPLSTLPYDLTVSLPNGQTSVTPSIVATASAASPSSLFRPTNHDGAFGDLDIYDDRSAAANVFDHFPQAYPAYLTTDSLLVTRPSQADTMAVLQSNAGDAIEFGAGVSGYPAYVEYVIDPPQYATSIGLLHMGKSVCAGAGELNDDHLPIVAATAYYVDGDSSRIELRVGRHMRNVKNGSFLCYSTSVPYYVQAPDDSLVAHVYSGGGVYYDAQEIRLQTSKRDKRVARIRLAELPIVHNCSLTGLTADQSLLNGVGLWPSLNVATAPDTGIGYQSQNSSLSYGGYVFGGDTVGTRRTLRDNGCQISCLSMIYNYIGVSCTPASLNSYLREHRGYKREHIAQVVSVSVTGDTIDFRGEACGSSDWRVGHSFLVERGPYNPLATVAIISKPSDCRSERAKARVVDQHQSVRISPGDSAWTYRYLVEEVAGRGFSNQAMRIQELPRSRGAAAVESLLVRGVPSYLCTHSKSGGWHFVVADGWRPAFVSSTLGRGTYTLKDPAYDRTRLIQEPFRNEFLYARRLVPIAAQMTTAGDVATTSSGETGLSIMVNGATEVEIVDPAGRRLYLDPITHRYESEIDDVFALHGWRDDDDEEVSTGDYSGQDLIQLPDAVDGVYMVRVVGTSSFDVGMTVNATNTAGVQGAAAILDTVVADAGIVYRLTYGSQGATIELERLAITAVDGHRRPESGLRVVRNPAFGSVRFEITGAEDPGPLEIFDILGRRVSSLPLVGGTPGVRTVEWDAQQFGRGAGVYFARLRWPGRARVVRFVLLR